MERLTKEELTKEEIATLRCLVEEEIDKIYELSNKLHPELCGYREDMRKAIELYEKMLRMEEFDGTE